MRRMLLGLVILQLCARPAPAPAQESTNAVQQVRLTDGSTFYGTLTEEGDSTRVVLASGGEIVVPKNRVSEVRSVSGQVKDGEFWRDDPNLTRLFFSPTARTLPRGRGYLAAYELLFPFAAQGVSDSFLIAGGTPLFWSDDFDSSRVYYLAPKLRVLSTGRTDIAVGAFHFQQVGASPDNASFGALYAAITQGTPDRALTLAVGLGYDDDGLVDEPVVMAGGEARVSRTIKLVTENYFGPGGTALLAFGPRFFGERLSADLALGIVVDEGDAWTFPIVNFVYVW